MDLESHVFHMLLFGGQNAECIVSQLL